MCGISGVYAQIEADRARDDVERGLRAMRYRGPNNVGIVCDKVDERVVALGHNRLSIIDLSPDGNQPMHSCSGDLTVVFNGEIYNYIELRAELSQKGWRFKTESDTEVLLAAWGAWGEECLERLDGMFAFVMHDRRAHRLFCVVDPFGIKPFYYNYCGESGFRFNSELQALVRMLPERLRLDSEAIYKYLVWGVHDVGEQTFIDGVSRLPPGHMLVLNMSGECAPIVRKWWRPSLQQDDSWSFEDATARMRELFLGAVSRQLRSDVPIGFALSGGVDSSSIVCAARYLEPELPIRTFSYVATEARLNERKWAEKVVDHVDAQPHWISDGAADFNLDSAMACQGEPFGSTSILAGFHVFQEMKREGVIVSLDGQGADESMGGYDGYPVAIMRNYLDMKQPLAALRFLLRWARWPGRGGRAAAVVLGEVFVPDSLRSIALRSLGYDAAPAWLSSQFTHREGISLSPPTAFRGATANRARRLSERLEYALSDNGLPRLLRYADRNSMNFSIESRVPFLSPQLVKFALSMPADYLVSREGESKRLFRNSMRGIVPEEVLNRRDKIGFATPELELLRRNRTKIDAWLEAASAIDILDANEVRSTVGCYLDGARPYKARCWRLINLCRWYGSVSGY